MQPTKQMRYFLFCFAIVIGFFSSLIIGCGGGGGGGGGSGGTPGPEPDPVIDGRTRVVGSLSVPSGMSPTDFSVVCLGKISSVSISGAFAADVYSNAITLIIAAPENGALGLMATVIICDGNIFVAGDTARTKKAHLIRQTGGSEDNNFSITPMSTAVSLVFQSPYLFSPDPAKATAIMEIIEANTEVGDLSTEVERVLFENNAYQEIEDPFADETLSDAYAKAIRSVLCEVQVACTGITCASTASSENADLFLYDGNRSLRILSLPKVLNNGDLEGKPATMMAANQGCESYTVDTDFITIEKKENPDKQDEYLIKIDSIQSNAVDWIAEVIELDPSDFKKLEDLEAAANSNTNFTRILTDPIHGSERVQAKGYAGFINFPEQVIDEAVGFLAQKIFSGGTPIPATRNGLFIIRAFSGGGWQSDGDEQGFVTSIDYLKDPYEGAFQLNAVNGVLDLISCLIPVNELKDGNSDIESKYKFIACLLTEGAKEFSLNITDHDVLIKEFMEKSPGIADTIFDALKGGAEGGSQVITKCLGQAGLDQAEEFIEDKAGGIAKKHTKGIMKTLGAKASSIGSGMAWLELAANIGKVIERTARLILSATPMESQLIVVGYPFPKPSDPANLRARAISSSQIQLSWEPSQDDSGKVKYKIYEEGAYGSQALFKENVLGTAITLSSLESREYCFSVSAIDEATPDPNESGKSNTSCAKTVTDTMVWSWGGETSATLGPVPSFADYRVPQPLDPYAGEGLQDVYHVSAGNNFTVGVNVENEVRAWGDGSQGQIGLEVSDTISPSSPTPFKIGTLSDVVKVSAGVVYTTITEEDETAAGGSHIIAMAKDADYVYAWGANSAGQLGNGNQGDISEIPLQVDVCAGVDAHVIDVSAGAEHSVAACSDGLLYIWGTAIPDVLGYPLEEGCEDISPPDTNKPCALFDYYYNCGETYPLPDVISVAAGAYHTTVLTVDGDVYTWGWNDFGQLGDSTQTKSRIPKKVEVLDNIQVVAVAAGSYHSLALTANGRVYSWGKNDYGQLGYPTSSYDCGESSETCRSTPRLVADLQDTFITRIAAGSYHSMALAYSGTAYSWGWNKCGQIGNGRDKTKDGEEIASVHEIEVLFDAFGLERQAFVDIAGGYCHSNAISIQNTIPTASIETPWDGEVFTSGDEISFSATAYDQEDTPSVAWILCNENERICTIHFGETSWESTNLPLGNYSAFLWVIDSYGTVGEDVVQFIVAEDLPWQVMRLGNSGGGFNASVKVSLAPFNRSHIIYYFRDELHTAIGHTLSDLCGFGQTTDIPLQDSYTRFAAVREGSGKIHFCYMDPTSTSLWYRNGVDSNWSNPVLLGSGHTNFFYPASMAVDKSGHVHISYELGENLYYATNASGSWETEVLVDGSASILDKGHTIALSGSGTPQVWYYDRTTESIKRAVPVDDGDGIGGSWIVTTISQLPQHVDTLSIHIQSEGSIDKKAYLTYKTSIYSDPESMSLYHTWLDLESEDENETLNVTKVHTAKRPGDNKLMSARSVTPAMAMDSKGNCHLCFYQRQSDGMAGLFYETNRTGSWKISEVDSFEDFILDFGECSIVTDTHDNVHIGYTTYPDTKFARLRYAPTAID